MSQSILIKHQGISSLKRIDIIITNILEFLPTICEGLLLIDKFLEEFGFINESIIFKLPVLLIWCIILPAILFPFKLLIMGWKKDDWEKKTDKK